MTYPANQQAPSYSSAKRRRPYLVAFLACVALMTSASAGAWFQAQLSDRQTRAAGLETAAQGQVSRDAAYIRENVNALAAKVGELQARIIAVSGLSQRVARAAGVAYTEPEFQAGLDQSLSTVSGDSRRIQQHAPGPGSAMAGAEVMDDIPDTEAALTAEGLGRRLDVLYAQLNAQADSFAMLDLLMTRRAGLDASLPGLRPVNYPYLSSSFGWRRNPVTGRHAMHEGLDFAAPVGAPIYAVSAGVVTDAGVRGAYGKLVEITHGNGLTTRYAHASAIDVDVGDLVEKGQRIARVGSTGRSTGAHLHFEVRMGGRALDPTLFLPAQDAPEHLVARGADSLGATDAHLR